MTADLALDEELWFGTDSNAAAEQAAASSMTATAGKIYGARPFPKSARALLELLDSDAFSTTGAAAIIERDAALSARVLQLVNSPALGLRIRCKSVMQAVALVGTSLMRDIATAAAMVQMFPAHEERAKAVFERSAEVAAFARHLGPSWSLPGGEMYSCGILLDLGKLMMLDTDPDGYGALLDECGSRRDEVFAAERKQYGYDSATLCAHLLKAWKIPSPIPKLVAWQNQTAKAYEVGGAMAVMVSVLRLASQLADELAAPERDVATIVASIGASAEAAYLDLDPPRIERLVTELRTLKHASPGEPSAATSPEVAGGAPSAKTALEAKTSDELPCAICGGAGFGESCPRCGGSLCQAHSLEPNRCCEACEKEWRARGDQALLGKREKAVAAVLGAMAVALAAAASATGAMFMRGGFLVMLAALVGYVGFAVRRHYGIRAAFVSGRSRPAHAHG
jgi:HD-like signal output (HDOD) protein/uncharacterized protein (DUF983 family)